MLTGNVTETPVHIENTHEGMAILKLRNKGECNE